MLINKTKSEMHRCEVPGWTIYILKKKDEELMPRTEYLSLKFGEFKFNHFEDKRLDL